MAFDAQLYRVAEIGPSGSQRVYIGFQPHQNSSPNSFSWRMSVDEIPMRTAAGKLVALPGHVFLLHLAGQESGVIRFDPLTLKTVKDADLWAASDLLDVWETDQDVLDFYTVFFAPFAKEMGGIAEDRGVLAKPGDIHTWTDGHQYRKEPDGSWLRLSTRVSVSGHREGPSDEWRDSDPRLPLATTDLWFVPGVGINPVNGKPLGPQPIPERRAIHTEILSKIFDDVPPVPPGEQAICVLTMGFPGAGKSSFAREYLAAGDMVNIDSDSLKAELPEFKEAVSLKVRNAGSIVHGEGTFLQNAALDMALPLPGSDAPRYNMVFDGMGGHIPWYTATIARLKAANYKVILAMPHVENQDELMKRIESRGLREGRFVPPAAVLQKWDVLPANFMTLAALVDEAFLMDNNTPPPKMVYRKTPEGDEVTDPDFWKRFQEKPTTESVEVPMPAPKGAPVPLRPSSITTDELIRRFIKGAEAEEEWLAKTAPIVKPGEGWQDDLLDPVPDDF